MNLLHYSLTLVASLKRATDEGSFPEIAQYSPYYLSLNILLLSKDQTIIFYLFSGEIDDEDDVIPQDRDWTAYWRLLFRKVTTQDLEDFEKNYKGTILCLSIGA